MTIQARTAEVFGVDIHPAASIAGGLMLDHGTGVVIGETSKIGRNCSFLHGTTLGSTGTSQLVVISISWFAFLLYNYSML